MSSYLLLLYMITVERSARVCSGTKTSIGCDQRYWLAPEWSFSWYHVNTALKPMQTDATSHNIVACCWGFMANNVASVCMGLKVWHRSNYTQQVPTLLWFHTNGHNMFGPAMLHVVGQQWTLRPFAWVFRHRNIVLKCYHYIIMHDINKITWNRITFPYLWPFSQLFPNSLWPSFSEKVLHPVDSYKSPAHFSQHPAVEQLEIFRKNDCRLSWNHLWFVLFTSLNIKSPKHDIWCVTKFFQMVSALFLTTTTTTTTTILFSSF